eukprot:TRINITY_DN5834_c0_g1_i1.p1 TRINITY_DN5834_c0_g1~~TRINITY_DN5834_c0_g1_i1.p1  ORF type:complete len:437 (-),score=44.81 TRINITY_DN5834_c0_g1_i1:137-1447(-)
MSNQDDELLNIKSKVFCCSLGMYNVLIHSFGFMILFAAYNTVQNYVTSLLPENLGSTSLVVLYVTVAITVFMAPMVVAFIGEKWTMVLGGACYVVYIASLIKVVKSVVLIAAVIIGFGASILWVAQGMFITMCSNNDERGAYSGIFWAIFQFSNVFGNLCAYLIFPHISKSALFATFTVTGCVGVLLLTLLKPIQVLSASTITDDTLVTDEIRQKKTALKTIIHSFYNTIVLCKNFRIILLFPIFFWTGFELAFWSGEFTQLLKPKLIGLVLMFVGIAEVCAAFTLGWLSDRIGRAATVYIGSVIYAVGLILTSFLKERQILHPQILQAPLVAFIAAFCFGIGDAIFNTQVYASLGQIFTNSSAGAFTIFQFMQNIGSAVGFFYQVKFPLHGDKGSYVQIWVQIGLLTVSTALYTTIVCIAKNENLKKSKLIIQSE